MPVPSVLFGLRRDLRQLLLQFIKWQCLDLANSHHFKLGANSTGQVHVKTR